MPLVDNVPEGPDTIRVLLTTDNHVGYNENDPIRGDDGWKTFNEITKLAKERDVDMMVQGGDLFHINKPSKKSLFHVIKSLRLNCMGDRPCELELLSDPSMISDNGFNNVNYEDPNLNISIPVFAISGNHDDATGDGLLSPLDVLAVSGLINHFGKIVDSEAITVSPLLFQKGRTKLALYGMANVRDERLHRAFRDGHVKFQRPNIQTDQWFNLFCIHQNHAQHSITSSIPESYLPNFLDFILWGHEHECIAYPVHNPETGFDVLQAGSSVATSLSEGEVADKHAFILNIRDRDYSIERIKLQSVRPFVMKEISLSKTDLIPGAASKSDVISYLVDEVDKAITAAGEKFKESNPDLFDEESTPESEAEKIPLPLIRLRVEYSGGYEIENVRRFSNRFVGKIANPNDVIQFYKKRTKEIDSGMKRTKFVDKDLIEEGESSKKSTEFQLQDLINNFIAQADLSLLPESGINYAVKKYIDNEDKHVVQQYIEKEIERETKILMKIEIADDFYDKDEDYSKKVFKQVLSQIKQEKKENGMNSLDVEMESEPAKKTNKTSRGSSAKSKRSEEFVISDDNSEEEVKETVPKKSRARTSRAKKPVEIVEESEDSDTFIDDADENDEENDDEVDSEPEPESAKKLASRGRKAATRGGTTRAGRGRGGRRGKKA
ncbi:Mre11 DNA double-strand break repair factor [Scheffersomyces xylosifermentans]|uniref:Mre11 DNA double-strand break repair factor n=1 Tax=Scheffersomyces xylosifermentans TaxID=1304137 RepID=UPI00315D06F3